MNFESDGVLKQTANDFGDSLTAAGHHHQPHRAADTAFN